MSVNPRSITDVERAWLEVWSPQVQLELQRRLQAAGQEKAAIEIPGWLNAQRHGLGIKVGAPRKAKWRKLLAAVGEPPPGPRRKIPALGEAGEGGVALLAAAGAGAAGSVALAAGSPLALAVALVAAPIILDDVEYVVEEDWAATAKAA